MEWHHALVSQAIPANWSSTDVTAPMSTLLPVRFQVADAQNIIVRAVINGGFEWLLFLEDDVLAPPTLFLRINEWMRRADTPVVSGLYYQKSEPVEPLVYRGRGNGAFMNFNPGEQVWADGVPTGCLLVHASLLKAMWRDSEVYEIGGQTTRRVFTAATNSWIADDGTVSTNSGTSDLNWCGRVMEGGYLAKAGWPKYQDRELPFLVDTRIACGHITPDGQVYPPGWQTTEV